MMITKSKSNINKIKNNNNNLNKNKRIKEMKDIKIKEIIKLEIFKKKTIIKIIRENNKGN